MSNDAKPYLIISAVIFAVVSIVHLARGFTGWDFVIGPWELPTLVSWLGFLVTAGLSGWGFWLAARR